MNLSRADIEGYIKKLLCKYHNADQDNFCSDRSRQVEI